MEGNEILARLSSIFGMVLGSDDIKLKAEMTADDIEEWDSLKTILLIAAVEESFQIKLPMKEVISAKTVGQWVNLIEKALYK